MKKKRKKKNEMLMKGGILMRVLFCKIQCPFMCFCKPSAANHIYTSGPLKLENSPNVVVPSTTDFAVSDASEKSYSQDALLKNCLRKVPCGPDGSTKEVAKKRVQWIDISGKQLAEIKEFESRGYRRQRRRKKPLCLHHSLVDPFTTSAESAFDRKYADLLSINN